MGLKSSALDMPSPMIGKLVDSLYVEAMVLTDEARAYFDEFSKADRSQLDPILRVSFSCESLKVTTRLMHIIAWLLAYRAREEETVEQFMLPMDTPLRLGNPVVSEVDLVARLPVPARQIIEQSIDLYDRVRRMDGDLAQPHESSNPAHMLMRRLEAAF